MLRNEFVKLWSKPRKITILENVLLKLFELSHSLLLIRNEVKIYLIPLPLQNGEIFVDSKSLQFL